MAFLIRRPRLTLIGNPPTNISSGKFLLKFCSVLNRFVGEVYVVNDGAEAFQPNNAHIVAATRGLTNRGTARLLGPTTRFLGAQFWLAIGLLKCIQRTDIVILFPVIMVLPALVSKLCRKPLLLYEAQDVFDEKFRGKTGMVGSVRYLLILLLRNVVLHLVDGIIVEGESVIVQNGLDGLKSKTYCWHQYVDTRSYQMRKPIGARDQLVGFLAALESRKGILEFAAAARLVNKKNRAIRFVIGGEGNLKPDVVGLLSDLILGGIVQVVGPVDESALCDFYNDLKLYVLPSGSEGLPNSILESMACGTPVLSTSVGAVPDVIVDGKTGFLLPDTDPETIAATILRVINDPDLALVSENSRLQVEREFSLEKSAELGAQVMKQVERTKRSLRVRLHDE